MESRVLLTAESWLGGTGNWNDKSNWSGNAVPLIGDQVNISIAGSVVNITDVEQVDTLTTAAGTTLTVTSAGSLYINSGGVNNGTMTLNAGNIGNGVFTNNATLNITGGLNVHTNLANSSTGTVNLMDDGGLTDNGTFTNQGLFEKTGGTGTSLIASGLVLIDLSGTISIQSGTLSDAGRAAIRRRQRRWSK